MTIIKANILSVINVAIQIANKNNFDNCLLEKENNKQEFYRKALKLYTPLKEKSPIIIILRVHCRAAVNDLIEEKYTKNVQNLLNEYYEVFSSGKIKRLSKVINC